MGVGRLERQAGEVKRGSAVAPPLSGTTSPKTLLSSWPSLFHCAHPLRLYLLAVLDDVGRLQVLLTHLLTNTATGCGLEQLKLTVALCEARCKEARHSSCSRHSAVASPCSADGTLEGCPERRRTPPPGKPAALRMQQPWAATPACQQQRTSEQAQVLATLPRTLLRCICLAACLSHLPCWACRRKCPAGGRCCRRWRPACAWQQQPGPHAP